MSESSSGTLRVPGAGLYYQTRGTGPVLLLLPGGAGDADNPADLAEQLADRFTVLSYDRRGLSRSTIDDPTEPITLRTHAEDAHHLLAALGTEPAFVVGSSIGALIGLDLATRHPEQVRTLFAHEPPSARLLGADRAETDHRQERMEEIYRRDGLGPAIQSLTSLAGANFGDREPEVTMTAPDERRLANFEFFFTHDAPAVRHYELDIAALRNGSTRVIPAGGLAGKDHFPYHCARALADALGVEMVDVPGDHVEYLTHPRRFALWVRQILAADS